MERSGDGRAFSLAGWRVVLADLGLSHVNVARRAGLPDDLLTREAPRVSTEYYYRLWQAVADESGDPCLPLQIGRAISVESFDPAVFAALCSPDLNVALRRLSAYKRLLAPVTLHVDVRNDGTRVALELPRLEGDPPPMLVWTELVFFVQLARIGTRAKVRPTAVELPRSLPDAHPELQAHFGVPLRRRGAAMALTFSAHDAARPFLTANEGMWASFEPELRRRLAQLDADATTAERTHAALLELLPSGLASADAVAGRLGISKRTLQRRLHAEGHTFQGLLDHTREKLARHYLERSSMSGAEISFLLGYEDPNSFFRAFHAWTGQTPESVRAERASAILSS